MKLQEFSAFFEPHLRQVLSHHMDTYKSLSDTPLIHTAINQTEHLAFSGGKYIRPYLVQLMYQAHGGTNSNYVTPFACGIELFHLFCLVHDDIMDHADTRRGIPTIHAMIRTTISTQNIKTHLIDIPESLAILIGDLLLVWSGRELSRYRDNETLSTLIDVMQDEVTAGQMMDLILCTKTQGTLEEIIKKTELKTAYYSFVRPMQFGVALAQGSRTSLDFCERFGRALGTAFQIRDDLINILDTSGVKSSPLSDLAEGQQTLFTYAVETFGTDAHRTHLTELRNKSVYTDSDIALAHELFRDSGAFEYAANYAKELFDTADEVLSHWTLPKEQKSHLEELSQSIRKDYESMMRKV